jgi:hypothetical protein
VPTKPPIQRRADGSTREQQRKADDARRNRKHEYRSWYWTARWRQIRQNQLTIEPLCANCLKHGRVTAATVCDHREPHRGDPDKFWNGPFQSLCDEAPWRCHSRLNRSRSDRRSNRIDQVDPSALRFHVLKAARHNVRLKQGQNSAKCADFT